MMNFVPNVWEVLGIQTAFVMHTNAWCTVGAIIYIAAVNSLIFECTSNIPIRNKLIGAIKIIERIKLT